MGVPVWRAEYAACCLINHAISRLITGVRYITSVEIYYKYASFDLLSLVKSMGYFQVCFLLELTEQQHIIILG